MKIKSLEIHNIASIEDASIDFEAWPLRDSNIFLICGETGSGKTTILDAICLALYNDTPRIRRAPEETYSESVDGQQGKGDGNRIGDVRQLMRRGTGEAWVKLKFRGTNGVDYTAQWYVNRARKKATGALQLVKRSLYNSATGIELIKKDEIKDEIGRAVGLDFEQFCRTTMLAQGEFTRFLQSKSKEKSDILEKLTGTGIYSRTGRKIYETAKSREQDYLMQKNLIGGIVLMTGEDKAALQASINEAEAQVRSFALLRKSLQDKANWMTEDDKLRKALEDALQARSALQAVMQSDDYRGRQRLVDDWFATSELRAAIAERARLEKKKGELAMHVLSLRSHLADRLSALEAFRHSLEAKRNSLNLTTKALDEAAVHKDMYDNAQTIIARLKAVSDAGDAVVATQGKIDRLLVSIKTGEDKLISLGEELAKRQAETKAADDGIEALDRQIALIDGDALREKVVQLNAALRDIADVDALAAQLRIVGSAVAAARKDIAGINGRMAAIIKSVDKLTKDEADARAGLEEVGKLYDRQKESVDDYARELRSHLHLGEACPVCGQIVGKLHDDAHFESLLAPIAEMHDAKRKEYDALLRQIDACAAEKKTLELSLSNSSRRLAASQAEHTALQARITDKCKGLGLTSAPETLPGLIDARSKAVNDELSRTNGQLKSLQQLVDKRSSLNVKRKGLFDEEQKVVASVNGLKISLAASKADLTNQRAALQSTQGMIADEMKSLDGQITVADWQNRWNDNHGTFIAALSDAAASYRSEVEKRQRLASECEEGDRVVVVVVSLHKRVLELFPDFGSVTPSASSPVSAALLNEWSDLYGEVKNVRGLIDDNAGALSECGVHIRALLDAGKPVDMAVLESLNKYDSHAINDIKSEIESTKARLVELKTLCDSSETALKKHHEVRPDLTEDETYAVVEAKLKDVETSINDANVRLGQLLAKKDENARAEIRFKDELARLEVLKEEYLKWDNLRSWFGDGTGEKFRSIAQSFVLRELLENANYYLSHFTRRYALECQPGSLTILLRDYYNGGTVRPSTTISGGESFIVSLSLALGLSSLGEKGIEVGTLFIDEGFGTLSENYLNTVMDTLETLHRMGGRKIGIISHVESLRERIKTQIQLKYVGNSTSAVTVVRCD